MKRTTLTAAIPALVFTGLLAAVSIFNIAIPQKDFSELENRTLAQFPALSAEAVRSGKWMTDFEQYSTDQFLFRGEFMRVKTTADLALMRRDNGRVYFGRDGYLFSADTISEKQEASNLTIGSSFLRRLRQEQPEVRTSVLLAPTAKSVLSELLPAHAPISDEQRAIKQAEAVLKQADPALCFTNPFDVLYSAAHSETGRNLEDSAQIYYRTDHHWTTDGAYAAYRLWAQENGFTPVSAGAFRRRIVSDSFLGTNQAKAPGYPVKPDSIVSYEPGSGTESVSGTERDSGGGGSSSAKTLNITIWKDITKPSEMERRASLYDEAALETKDQYTYFLGGNDPQVIVRTPNKNGRRLLLIKDSYANCFIPFLAQHYEEIYITDLRYSHGKLVFPAAASDAEGAGGCEDAEGSESSEGSVDPANAASANPNLAKSFFTDVMFLYNIESFCSDRNMAYLTQMVLAPPAAL